ncbi:DUF929 domain-containing protein [Picrophilus oshimae]|uniref:Hypothetical membrane associated protein n=1 Tax=Picrophilus torridus (strain ATCC 700027 / DSM 9790 / JCM 10055 / NBRC 100828 / KAW 2/3) TaxID=1122961 RepID=Q6KZB9_PICTO|nr:DUF929 domain-containing protein [Picrophilus oshimae]AAT43933.1 hypothetical membrane associated protein [Picrophilus oshimae DSM 9789]SMD30994.1 protein of unknown function [Picrophilus oshimae DSM 9789]
MAKNNKRSTNKNQKNKNSASKNQNKKNNINLKNKNVIGSAIAAVIIVVLVVVVLTHPLYRAPFSAPSSISSDKYYMVSNRDMLSNGSSGVFFISWYGCPIGATDSWAIYYAINSTTDIYKYVELHTADPGDIYSNGTTGQPGLLFKGDFTFKTTDGYKYTFYPIYMYNETMTGTINNKPINGSLAAYGLSVIKAEAPPGIYNIMKKYESDVTYDNHITTTFIITGPSGTYILNAYMYAPRSGGLLGSGSPQHGAWNPNPPQYVMEYLNTSSQIKSAANTFMSYLNDAR